MVVDQKGKPVSSVRVNADGRKCHEQHCETFTDKEGKYSLYVRPDQTIILNVIDGRTDVARRVSNSLKIQVPSPGETVDDCNLKLVEPVRVKAKIVNVDSGKLVAGYRMSAWRYAMEPGEYEKKVLEDPGWHIKSFDNNSRGNWSNLPSSDVWVWGTDTGPDEFVMLLAPGFYLIRPNDDDKEQLFYIKPVKEMNIELKTNAGAKETISGKVTVEGKPAENAKIVAVNKRFRGDRWEAETDEKGDYSINIREEPGLVVAFSEDKSQASAFEFETVKPRVDLALKPVGKIHGRLLDADSSPVAGTRVYFGTELWVPPYGGFVVTDKDGKFEIPHVCPDIMILLSVDNIVGRREKLATISSLAPGTTWDVQDLKLSKPREQFRNGF